jgi:hypothetical protein
MLSIRNRLRHLGATVDEINARLYSYMPEPVERSGIHPSDTARFGILLGANGREHG